MSDAAQNTWLANLPLLLSFATASLASILLFLAKRQDATTVAAAATAAASAATATAAAAATAATAVASAAANVAAIAATRAAEPKP